MLRQGALSAGTERQANQEREGIISRPIGEARQTATIYGRKDRVWRQRKNHSQDLEEHCECPGGHHEQSRAADVAIQRHRQSSVAKQENQEVLAAPRAGDCGQEEAGIVADVLPRAVTPLSASVARPGHHQSFLPSW